MHVININCPSYPRVHGANQSDYFMAALVQDATGGQAVYVALVRLNDSTDEHERHSAAESVAYMGCKLSHASALAHFPGLDEEKYR